MSKKAIGRRKALSNQKPLKLWITRLAIKLGFVKVSNVHHMGTRQVQQRETGQGLSVPVTTPARIPECVTPDGTSNTSWVTGGLR